MSNRRKKKGDGEGEFLWLVSLSDLMILLFVFFVVLFSFSFKKMSKSDFAKAAAMMNNQEVPKTPIDEVKGQIDKMINDLKLPDVVNVQQDDDGLVMDIRDKILFESAEYALREQGKEVVGAIGSILAKVPAPYKIAIEGHTDDVPIHTKHIQDNWELSTRRAHTILHALTLGPETLKRTAIMGYADMRPIVPNRTPTGEPLSTNKQKNRRVTIRIY